jgi:hypothetical protein
MRRHPIPRRAQFGCMKKRRTSSTRPSGSRRFPALHVCGLVVMIPLGVVYCKEGNINWLLKCIEHQLGQKRRTLVLYKLLERNRWTAEQTGDCVRDGRRRAAGEVTEQFGYRPDVPFGHSRFAHSVSRRRERHVHVLDIPTKNRRQLFSDLVKSQSFRSGDDIGLSFVTGGSEYLCSHGTRCRGYPPCFERRF